MTCPCIACRTDRYVREWAEGQGERPPDDMIKRWIQIKISAEEQRRLRKERE